MRTQTHLPWQTCGLLQLWYISYADVNLCTPFPLYRKPCSHRQDVDLFVAQDIEAADQHVVAVCTHARSGLPNDHLAIPGNNNKQQATAERVLGKQKRDRSEAHF